jgi:ureidoacrylate peracid hydrolase
MPERSANRIGATTRELHVMTEEVVKAVRGTDYFRIDPTRCAVIVIDMQNSFLEVGAVFETPNGRRIIPNINRIVGRARQALIPVIWTQSDHSPPGGGLILERHPVIKETKELWRGERSFELYREMVQPNGAEHRIVKHKYDAFFGTNLDEVLKTLKRDTVVLVGVATDICCESTAMGAFFREYRVVFLRDGTAAVDPELQDLTCDRVDKLFGRVLSTDDLIRIFEKGGE